MVQAWKMRKIVACGSMFLLILLGLLPSGYVIETESDTVAYSSNSNAPVSDHSVSIFINKGSKLALYGCIDDGSDISYFVKSDSGEEGYVWELKFKKYKSLKFSLDRLKYFSQNFINAVQCHIMANEYSTHK